jgi:hypothetical protein
MSSYHGWTHAPKAAGGTDPVKGYAVLFIKVFADDLAVAAGDGKFMFDISEDMDGMELVIVESYITTVSSSGAVTVTIRNNTQSVEMLTTGVTIDQGEKNSRYAATPYVISTTNDDVAWADELSINVDAAGTGAKGLGVHLFFV